MSQQILKEFCCLPAFLEQYFGVPKTSFKKKYFENPQIPKAISEPSPKKKWGFLILDSLEKNFTEPSANCSKVFGAFKAPPPFSSTAGPYHQTGSPNRGGCKLHNLHASTKISALFSLHSGTSSTMSPFQLGCFAPCLCPEFFPPRVPDNLFKFEFEFQLPTSFPFGHCSVSTRPHINFSRHPLPYQP